MTDLFISNVDNSLLKRFYNRINKLRPTGKAQRGDVKKYTIQAIEQWLDNTTPKDRGHLLLQKEIDELKAENLRLNSADNPAYQQLVKENREMQKALISLKTAIYIEHTDVQEVFEILCSIPTEHSVLGRHPAIEAMIQQLKDRIEKEE